MYVTVFNPGESPVVISERGNVVGGGEWATAETTDAACSAALEAGTVLKVDQPGTEDVGHEAGSVLDQTARYADRAEVVAGMDKAALMKIATRAHLVSRDEDPLRADLERRLIESDVELKAQQKPKSKSE